MSLTLNQRSYLMEKLEPIYPYENWWGLTEVITEGQRGRLLFLLSKQDTSEIKNMLENIINFQLMPNKAKG